MPPQINSGQPDEPTSPSRRSILRGAAGAGAVGLTAAVGGGLFAVSSASAATKAPAARPAAESATLTDVEHADEPVVVYLNDARSGEFEILSGTKQVTVRNKQLVNELLAGLKTAQ
jgi:hypothetical protein